MDHLILQVEILWPAMLAGLLVLSTHVPLGREVLQRGIIFLDLAIAQTAAFGVVLAHTLSNGGHSHGQNISTSSTAILAAIIGAYILYSIRKLEVRLQESFIGILFVLMATGIILLLSTDPHGGERLKEILVGQILWLQPQDLLQPLVVYGVIIVSWIFMKKKMDATLFYPLFAISITLSTQIVGVYLVFASLIIPSVATLPQERPLIKAYAIGIIGYALGLFISASFDLPAGASIVWSLSVIAIIFYAFFGKSKTSKSNTTS